MVEISSFFGNVSFERFVLFIFVIIATSMVGSIASHIIIKLLREKVERWVYKTISKIVMYAIYIAGFYLGFNKIIHFNLTAFAAAFGLLTIAIAFSAKQTLENMIAGILLAIDRPFKEEDMIEIGGSLCMVMDITLRRTQLRALDGRIFYVPNSTFVAGNIVNHSKGEFIKVNISFSVAAQSDMEKVKAIIKEICYNSPNILPNVPEKKMNIVKKFFHFPKDPKAFEPKIYYKGIDKEKITLEVWFWIWEIIKKESIISNFFDKLRIEFKNNNIEFG